MNHLIQHLSRETGLSTEKSYEVLLLISEFVKEKYPLLEHTVDSVLELSIREEEIIAV